MTKFSNYIGQKIGKLQIDKISDYTPVKFKKVYFDCTCECGKKVTVNASKVVRGVLIGCQNCKHRGNSNPKWKGYEEMSGTYLKNLKNCALSRKGIKAKFEVSNKYIWDLFLKQNRKCALSGLLIEFAEDSYHRGTASLDRISSTIGYIEGNVQWVHKDINKMKTDFTQDRFLELCKQINDNFYGSNNKVKRQDSKSG